MGRKRITIEIEDLEDEYEDGDGLGCDEDGDYGDDDGNEVVVDEDLSGEQDKPHHHHHG